ncbi:MAG: hypothetical protein ACFFHD_12910 [Promethearchaeota archaeon]
MGKLGKRNKIVHIAFTKEELEEIDNNNDCSTRSEFIRLAIEEKIRKIKNPNIYNGIGIGTINQELLEKLLKSQERQEKRLKIIEERNTTLEQINEILKSMKPSFEKKEVERYKVSIDKILDEHNGKYNIKKLMEETKLHNDLYNVLAAFSEEYKINSKKEVERLDKSD